MFDDPDDNKDLAGGEDSSAGLLREDGEQDGERSYTLTEAGSDLVSDWVLYLHDCGYDLEDNRDLYQAAGYLIAQGKSHLDYDSTLVMLVFGKRALQSLKSSG